MIVGWAVLSPLSKLSGWAPGSVGDMTNGARGWILWVSLAIMIADSVISLVPVIREFCLQALRPLRRKNKLPTSPRLEAHSADESTSFYSVNRGENNSGGEEEDEADHESSERLVPSSWVLWGLGASIVFGIVLVWWVFGAEGIRPWATLIGYLMGAVLSLLG